MPVGELLPGMLDLVELVTEAETEPGEEPADARSTDRLVEAHYVLGAAISFVGHPEIGLRHLDQAIALFDPHKHGFSRFRLGPSTGVVARVASGLLLWQRGSVEAGVGRVEEGLALARQLEHPYSIAYALYHNGFLSLNRRLTEECTAYANELSAIAAGNDYLVWGTLAEVLPLGISIDQMRHSCLRQTPSPTT